MREDDLIGYIVGEATIQYAWFVASKTPSIGQYIELEYDNLKVLGVIQKLLRGCMSIPDDIYDAEAIRKIINLEKGLTQYTRGKIKILGDIKKLILPKIPPPPGTKVVKASNSTLAEIFGDDGKGIRLGVLATNPDIPVYVNVNKMISRHLAILAITGAGKSNTVAVITNGLLTHMGTVLIIDMHSEYVGLEFPNGRSWRILPKINPFYLHPLELARLMNIDAKAYVQERYFRRAYKEAKNAVIKKEIRIEDFMNKIKDILDSKKDVSKADKSSIIGVLNKIEDFEDKYSDIISYHTPPLIEQIKTGVANILDLGRFDEEAADVIVSHILRNILRSRKDYTLNKKGLPVPIFIILEEAHILAPNDRHTLSKYWINRISREGRKFGVGLCLVSQRPKALDSNSLSQVNNMIIMKLVEPSDQRYVQQASETLSEDLLEQLPGLNVGEAIVIGQMIKIPALVKIDHFKQKSKGVDLDVVSEWLKYSLKKVSEEDLDIAIGDL